MERKDEVAAVKRALRQAGIPFRHVRHGTGTARGWLHIGLMHDAGRLDHIAAVRLAQVTTGRHGEYDGRINT